MNLPAILSAYQLGTLINSSPLHGGAMHHTFHVTTEQGEFVVKHLNQELEQFHTLEVTEAVATAAKIQGFPARTALLCDKKAVFIDNAHAYIIYPYLHGDMISAEQLTPQHIQHMATASATLHQLTLSQPDAPTFKPFMIQEAEWSHYMGSFSHVLTPRLSQFLEIATRHLSAFERLKQHTVVSHRDFTPGNLLWQNDHSFSVIDWELAGWINPELEMLNNAIDTANTESGIKTDNVFCYLAAYKQAMGHLRESPMDLIYGCLGSWVHWILFCLKRQNHDFKPLNTEKMIRQSLHVIDFLLENANDIAKILLN